MKIDPNISTNFQQQDLDTTPAGSAHKGVDTDRLEAFTNSNLLFGSSFEQGGQSALDKFAGARLLLGSRPESFGLPLIEDTETPAADGGVNWDDNKYPIDWLSDGMQWLGENFMRAPEAGEWLVDKFVDAAHATGDAVYEAGKAVGEGVYEAGKAVGEGAVWVGEQVYDSVSSWAEQTVDGIITGAETAVDAISDALDW